MSDQDWSQHAIHIGLAAAVLHERFERLQGEKEDRIDDAKDHYRNSLRALERAVDDQGLKEEAFLRGIVYAGLMRDAGREDEFDERSVADDIQRVLRTGQQAEPSPREGPVARLQNLEAVRDAGLITDEEYNRKRQEIINSI